MGQYASRRGKVYEAVKASNLSDLKKADDKKDTDKQKPHILLRCSKQLFKYLQRGGKKFF